MWCLSQAGTSQTQTMQQQKSWMSSVRWQPDLIAVSYTSKLLLDQRCANHLTHMLKIWLSHTIGNYKHTILSWWHWKTTSPLDGQSESSSGSCVLEESRSCSWTITTGCTRICWFAAVPREQRSQSPIVLDIMRASIEALALMCRLHFSPSLQNITFDTDDKQNQEQMQQIRTS